MKRVRDDGAVGFGAGSGRSESTSGDTGFDGRGGDFGGGGASGDW